MPFAKRPFKPKAHFSQHATMMFPSLHEDIQRVLATGSITPEPWFNDQGEGVHNLVEEYETHIMGHFECRNRNCSKPGWDSKKIGIVIRRFHDNGYNAVVFKQRCKDCNKLGVLRLDENSYVERIAYRLKKWAGIPTERPVYGGQSRGPHETSLCEACKAGYCQEG